MRKKHTHARGKKYTPRERDMEKERKSELYVCERAEGGGVCVRE